MSEKDIQTHLLLQRSTGLHKITKDQRETMERIMGDTAEFTLEDETITDPYDTVQRPILKPRG